MSLYERSFVYPLFIRERPGRQITTRALSVGSLVFTQIDQISILS